MLSSFRSHQKNPILISLVSPGGRSLFREKYAACPTFFGHTWAVAKKICRNMLRQPNHVYTIIKEGTAADRADIVACRDKIEEERQENSRMAVS